MRGTDSGPRTPGVPGHRALMPRASRLEVALQAINEGALAGFFTKPAIGWSWPSDQNSVASASLMLEARRLLRVTRKQAATLEHLERHHRYRAVRRDQ